VEGRFLIAFSMGGGGILLTVYTGKKWVRRGTFWLESLAKSFLVAAVSLCERPALGLVVILVDCVLPMLTLSFRFSVFCF